MSSPPSSSAVHPTSAGRCRRVARRGRYSRRLGRNRRLDPTVLVRRVMFAVSVIVREDDPFLRFALLDRLSSVVQNTLDGSNLGGGCLPSLTKTRRGHFQAGVGFPEQSIVIQGEFTYLISTFDGHSTTPILG